MTLGVGSEETACDDATWGSTDIPTGDNVRLVGTWADIYATWGAEETTDWTERKRRVERTWTMEVTGCWGAGGTTRTWEDEPFFSKPKYCFFLEGESGVFFSADLLVDWERGLRTKLTRETKMLALEPFSSTFITMTSWGWASLGEESSCKDLSLVSSSDLLWLWNSSSKCSSKGAFPRLALGWLVSWQ